MNKGTIVDELNYHCENTRISIHWGDWFKWTEDDIDIENDRSRSYCARTRSYWKYNNTEILKDRDNWDEELCNSCRLTLNKYKNLHTIDTEKPNTIFEKIMERLDSLEKLTQRIEKIEEDIKMIRGHLNIEARS
jgi:hypothetical protein